MAMIFAGNACAPYQSARRTMYRNLSEYPPVHDAKESCAVYRRWAEGEWAQLCEQSPSPYAQAYRRGYIEGFVDAVYAGGNGDPPVVPPRPYWRIWFRNAMGDDEITTWSQGFRHGARTALEGGYRDRALIPTTLPMTSHQEPLVDDRAEVHVLATPYPPLPAGPAPIEPAPH